MKSMMKAIVLIALVLIQARTTFELYTTFNECTELEIDSLNRILTNDVYFTNMREVEDDDGYLKDGTYGEAIVMFKEDDDGNDKYYAVKIHSDSKVINYQFPVTKEHLDIPRNELNTSINSIRMTDYLISNGVPFILNTITYRHIIFENPSKDANYIPIGGVGFPHERNANERNVQINFSTFVVSAIELTNYDNLIDFARTINMENKNDAEKMNIFLDIFYKTMIAIEGINNNGIVHNSLKPTNISIRDFALFEDGEEPFAPVIGHWDLAQEIKDPKRVFTNIHDTDKYTPPEMKYFRNNIYKCSPTGYIYSGKEDIYSMAITMMVFAYEMRIFIDEHTDLGRLLENMAYPLSFEELQDIALRDQVKHKRKKMKYIKEELERNETREDLLNLSERIYRAMTDHDNLNDRTRVFLRNNKRIIKRNIKTMINKETTFSFVNKFISEKREEEDDPRNLFRDIIGNGIDEVDIENYFHLLDELMHESPFLLIKERRPNTEEILLTIAMMKIQDHPGKIDKLVAENKERIKALMVQDYNVEAHDENESSVWVDPSIYEYPLNDLKSIFKDYNNFRLDYANIEDNLDVPINELENEDNINIPNREVALYNSYTFGRKIMNMINEKKAETEINMVRNFIDLYPFEDNRKLRDDKQSKAVRKENIKTII